MTILSCSVSSCMPPPPLFPWKSRILVSHGWKAMAARPCSAQKNPGSPEEV